MTVTVYVFATEPLHERVLDCDEPSVTLEGESVQVRPELGETDDVSDTVPVNALTGATVIVELPDAPVIVFTLVGLADTVKSGAVVTVTVTVAVRVSPPPVAVMVTVYVPDWLEVNVAVDGESP